MTPPSPITGGETQIVETVPSRLIVDLYKSSMNTDVSNILCQYQNIYLAKCIDTGYEFFYPLDVNGGPKFYKELYGQKTHEDWAYKGTRWEFEAVLDKTRRTGRALDIGAGDGALLARLAERFDDVVGLETNPFGREGARARGLALLDETVETHAAAHAGAYDLVTAMQVLEHVSDVAGFLRAAATCLAPGGRLVIAVPDNDGFVGMKGDLPLNMPPHHVGRWRASSLKAVAPHLGLRVVSIEHEPLGEDVIGWYQSTVERAYGPRSRIARSLYHRLGGHAAVGRFLREQRHTIHGHTVMAVYETA